ncbi:uncharacterized protein Dana_GF24190 [Drosophila ananassae]|uniref:DUF4794 domain-containing protein n=1 Tax=Drosophila ananassae TaxID=7217 RepID=B3M8K6_DROAN|nr:uncharacterized protein LOC6506823 [Drosophila ananassae]EDV39980.1 uncharacterized protein Dana_GF24190 [Drosophila ananassae]
MHGTGLRSLLGQLVIVVILAQVLGRLHKRNGYHYRPQQPPPLHQNGYFEPHHPAVEPPEPEKPQHSSKGYYSQSGGGGGSGKGSAGYSIGSGLRSIAQGSADQAYSAVANQHAAAKQAAYIAQNTLAQAASQAAATAQAALVGKQVVLQELEQQAAEAQRSLSRELEQLKAAKISAKLAQQTAQAAHHHISVLTAAVNNAKSVAEQAEQTSTEVNNQLASQSTMVGQAKNRLEQVEEQLHQARVDFAATKESALKAASSAAAAQVNASKAAQHATIGLHESTNPSAHGHEGQELSGEEESYDEHLAPSGGGEISLGHTAHGEEITEHVRTPY